jgi:hypothetical protein
MKPALHFFAPFLALPLLWVYFSYVHASPHLEPPPLLPPSPELEIKAATPEDPGPIATVISPIQTLERDPQASDTPEWSAASGGINKLDRTDHAAIPHPKHFLLGRFNLTDRRDFAFTVPPNIVNPRLQGSFRASSKSDPGAGLRADEIDFALMDDGQFDDFVHGRRADATYEGTSTGEEISISIPPTHEQERRYHVVFMTESSRPAVVDADFTVSFQ